MADSHDIVDGFRHLTAMSLQPMCKPQTEVVWQDAFGSRLMLGNAFDVMPRLRADSVDCVWTDPPYRLSNDGITCRGGRMVSVNKGDWDRSEGLAADHAFNREWLAACYRLLRPAGCVWVSGTIHVYPSIATAMREVGFRILNDIIWEKPDPPPNLGRRCFTHSTEILLWATKPSSRSERYVFNYELMRVENGGTQMKNVWRGFAPPTGVEKRYGKHPTQKPVQLIGRCLRATTNVGDIVFDPFAGSASTGIAALQSGRRFVGSECRQEFVELGVKRLRAIAEELAGGSLWPTARTTA